MYLRFFKIYWYMFIRFSNSRSSHEIGRGSSGFSAQQQRGLYLDIDSCTGYVSFKIYLNCSVDTVYWGFMIKKANSVSINDMCGDLIQ